MFISFLDHAHPLTSACLNHADLFVNVRQALHLIHAVHFFGFTEMIPCCPREFRYKRSAIYRQNLAKVPDTLTRMFVWFLDKNSTPGNRVGMNKYEYNWSFGPFGDHDAAAQIGWTLVINNNKFGLMLRHFYHLALWSSQTIDNNSTLWV